MPLTLLLQHNYHNSNVHTMKSLANIECIYLHNLDIVLQNFHTEEHERQMFTLILKYSNKLPSI